jgi:StbA protein.
MSQIKKFLIAGDVGNKQSKTQTEKGTTIIPSAFAIQNPNISVLVGQDFTLDELEEYQLPSLSDKTYLWGTAVTKYVDPEEIIETLDLKDRYDLKDYYILVQMNILRKALDYLEPDQTSGEVDIDLIWSLPTDDFRDDHVIETLTTFFKKDGGFTGFVGEIEIKVNIHEFKFLEQSNAIIVDMAVNNNGELVNDDLFNERVAVGDIGGGTIILDKINKLQVNRSERNTTFGLGIHVLFDRILSRPEISKYNFKQITIQEVIRNGLQSGVFEIKLNKRKTIPVTELVNEEIQSYTNEIIAVMKKTWGNMDKYDSMVINGGGANIINFQTILSELADFAVISTEPEIATVHGLYKFGIIQGFGQYKED